MMRFLRQRILRIHQNADALTMEAHGSRDGMLKLANVTAAVVKASSIPIKSTRSFSLFLAHF
jgi:hypothetical protein